MAINQEDGFGAENPLDSVASKSRRLRVGLLIDDFVVSAWMLEMFTNIAHSDYAEIVLVVKNGGELEQPNKTIYQKISRNRGRLAYLAIRRGLELVYENLIERNLYLRDAEQAVDSKPLLRSVNTLIVNPIRRGTADYIDQADITAIKQQSIDILVRCGFGILKGDILGSARYGVWSFHHGDNRVNRGGPAGFWESMENSDESGSILQIINEDLDNGKVLYRSFSCTDCMSVQDNKSNYYWKSLLFMTRKMQELHRVGEEAFFLKVNHENRHPVFYSKRLYTEPTNIELAKLTFNKVRQKIALLLNNALFVDQWIIMYHLKDEFSSSLWRYKKIVPPVDRFWADPHVLERDGTYYLYIEEYLYKTGKGHISLIKIEADGRHSEPEIVLAKPYHLSYPFMLEHEGNTYMVPESMENNSIELYECVEFPNKWQFKMNLMEDIQAVDATLHYHNGKWWLFANVVEIEGASSWDELCLFYSDNLLSDNWQSHPQNPIVSDCKSARPAGKIFADGGRLYRPSQNCSRRYGYGFNVCEITTLNEYEYEEQVVSRVKPDWDKNIIGTHTFNREKNLHVIDALQKRLKWSLPK